MPPLKSGGAQHVSGGAVGVAGLRVGGYAGLFPPREATLDHHAEFAVLVQRGRGQILGADKKREAVDENRLRMTIRGVQEADFDARLRQPQQ